MVSRFVICNEPEIRHNTIDSIVTNLTDSHS